LLFFIDSREELVSQVAVRGTSTFGGEECNLGRFG